MQTGEQEVKELLALKIISILLVTSLVMLLLILLLRVGVTVTFGEKAEVSCQLGTLRRSFPQIKKKQADKKQNRTEAAAEKTKKGKKKRTFPHPTFAEYLDLASTALSALHKALRRTCKHLRIDPLEVSVVFGGADPAEIAAAYGYANAALWTIMPLAEDTFCVPDPSIHLRMDYDAQKTKAVGTIGVSLRILAIIAIALTLAFPFLRWYQRVKKTHKNDLKNANASDTSLEQSENRTA